MSKKINITILGATGSIGVSALDVLSEHLDKFYIYALTCNQNLKLMLKLCSEFQPEYVVIANELDITWFCEALSKNSSTTKVLQGKNFLIDVANDINVDYVLAAIVGSASLEPIFAAAQAGKIIGLASKEAMVMAGNLLTQTPATLIPIDSEHNAIMQVLPIDYTNPQESQVRRFILTASGGAFRQTAKKDFQYITKQQALTHPNWSMGAKITIDSATLMNKGLELIEACFLFNVSSNLIDVVIHPQSIVHSAVEYIDGSIIAQLCSTDMRVAISHALAYPKRISNNATFMNLCKYKLEFIEPDHNKFPTLNFAKTAIETSQSHCIAINAANEVAVDAFLHEQIKFTDIFTIIEETLNHHNGSSIKSLEDVLHIDSQTRYYATQLTKYK